MLSQILVPVGASVLETAKLRNPGYINTIHEYHRVRSLEGYAVAMLGVKDFRGHVLNQGTEEGPDAVRRHLYTYSPFTNNMPVLDLGNIVAGESYADTQIALEYILRECFKKNIIVLILGGDIALTRAQYKAYELFEVPIHLTQVASQVVWEENEIDQNRAYLLDIFQHHLLKKYSLVAYQSYLVHDLQLSTLSKMQFDCLRVGKIREHLLEAEPYIREADAVSFDVNAIRFSDAPGQCDPSPNGLFGDEACALVRFAGMSDKVMSLGLYDFNPKLDQGGVTAKQMAQMAWYFVEGVSLRRTDYPITDENDFHAYTVQIDEADNDFIFLKSKKTDRWWMKVVFDRNNTSAHKIIPCTYKDYVTALNNEIPERWMREYIRVS